MPPFGFGRDERGTRSPPTWFADRRSPYGTPTDTRKPPSGWVVAKTGLPLVEAFARGVLCNALVCLAIWLALGGRSVSDKILAIVFPISAFVALGFEHSVANWFLLPFGALLDTGGSVTALGMATNLVAVTAGNIVGGTLLVAVVYWFAYLRGGPTSRSPSGSV